MRDGAQEVKEMARTFLITFVAIFMVLATLTAGLAAVDDVKLISASIAVSQNVVSGQFKLENPAGSGNMAALSLLEMSIRKPGGAFLAIFGAQEMCDPTHPENVNKLYQLDAGEIRTFSLATPQLPDGLYEVWCETANACYANNPQTFRSEGPCKGGMKLADLDLRATTSAPVLQPTQPVVTGTTQSEAEVTVQPGGAASGAKILWKAIGLAVGVILTGIILVQFAPLPGILIMLVGALLFAFGLFGGG